MLIFNWGKFGFSWWVFFEIVILILKFFEFWVLFSFWSLVFNVLSLVVKMGVDVIDINGVCNCK